MPRAASAPVLAVRASDFAEQLAPAAFHGLPREEIERLHGSLEVVGAAPDAGLALLPLQVMTVVHHNYAWLTFGETPRQLGVARPLLASSGEPAPFLDPAYQELARRALEAQLSLPECEWRLVGLLHDTQPESAALVMVYVARLRRAWRDPGHADRAGALLCGSGELRLSRAEFDTRSQTLIDHLHAF